MCNRARVEWSECTSQELQNAIDAGKIAGLSRDDAPVDWHGTFEGFSSFGLLDFPEWWDLDGLAKWAREHGGKA